MRIKAIFYLLLTVSCFAQSSQADLFHDKPKSESFGSFLNIPKGIPKRFKAETTPPLIMQALILACFAMIPFMVMLLTPFAKLVMVFSLLRNALGVQQVPPNQLINGISLILSLFVMFPVGLDMYNRANIYMSQNPPPPGISETMPEYVFEIAREVKEPIKEFLKKNTNPAHIKHFFRVAFKTSPDEFKDSISVDDFMILLPAYITSQVKNGFEIGTLIFLPFFVIDVVVSNILLAMGMMMLSPVTISLPIKIFLLVMLDGWTLLTKGLIDSYKLI